MTCQETHLRQLIVSNPLKNNPLADLGGQHWCVPPPPTGSISFVFTYVFAKKCMHWRLVPPKGLAPPQREILDPPLQPDITLPCPWFSARSLDNSQVRAMSLSQRVIINQRNKESDAENIMDD